MLDRPTVMQTSDGGLRSVESLSGNVTERELAFRTENDVLSQCFNIFNTECSFVGSWSIFKENSISSYDWQLTFSPIVVIDIKRCHHSIYFLAEQSD